MTDVKALPENIDQLGQLTEFKRVYKKYTVDQLETQLIEKDVEFLSADNKDDLVWRLLDSQGFDFEAALAEANGEQSEPQPEPQPEPQDEPQDEPADEQPTDEQPAEQDEPTDKPADEAPADEQVDDQPATEPTDKPADEPVDQTDDQPVRNNPFFERRKQLKNNMPADEEDKDHVAVFNTGAFPFFETATSTLVPAKKTTKIYPTASVSKDQIMRNVKQYNHTRGNKLRVIN